MSFELGRVLNVAGSGCVGFGEKSRWREGGREGERKGVSE